VIKAENQTLATITLQNYFRLYSKLAGMTGTADTEAAEFQGTYKLAVCPSRPTSRLIRLDQGDLVYKNESGKFDAVVADIVARHAAGQPVLVGTTSVEKSELLSSKLKKQGVPHEVLNAKQHAREAPIIAQAGRKGAVTVATNMAGPWHRHHARRQTPSSWPSPTSRRAGWTRRAARRVRGRLAGRAREGGRGGGGRARRGRHARRAVRAGDRAARVQAHRQPAAWPVRPAGRPGESRFYLSLQDDLMRLFNSQMAESLMTRPGSRTICRSSRRSSRAASPARSPRSRRGTSRSARTS